MKQLFSVFAFALALVSCVNEELINVETAPVDEAEVVSAVYEAGEVAVKFTRGSFSGKHQDKVSRPRSGPSVAWYYVYPQNGF